MKKIRCPLCKKMYEFEGLSQEYCPQCAVKEEAEYKKVHDYIQQHPRVTLEVVASECNVSPAKLMKYIKQERIEIAVPSNWYPKCETCGKAITTGIKCDYCK